MTALILLLVLATTPQTGPVAAEPAAGISALAVRLQVPYADERSEAVHGLGRAGPEALSVLIPALDHPDYRARAGAAAVAATTAEPGLLLPLVRRFAVEEDAAVARSLARALARFETRALEALGSAGISGEDRKHRLFIEEAVSVIVEDILRLNTTPGGDFKGFYDDQFARVTALGPAVDGPLHRIAINAKMRDVERFAAIRALGSTGRGSARELLRDIRGRRNWRVDDEVVQRDQELEDPFLEATAYALAWLGDGREMDQRIARIREIVEGLERQYASLRSMRGSAVEQIRIRWGEDYARWLFKLGYESMQIRDHAEARKWFVEIATKLPGTGFAETALYNVACMASKDGHVAEALAFLERAILAGYGDGIWIHRDSDLARLREDPRFAELMKKYNLAP